MIPGALSQDLAVNPSAVMTETVMINARDEGALICEVNDFNDDVSLSRSCPALSRVYKAVHEARHPEPSEGTTISRPACLAAIGSQWKRFRCVGVSLAVSARDVH